jgi:Immunoglobulin domain
MNAGTSFSLLNSIIGPSQSGKNGDGDFADEGGNLCSDTSLNLGPDSLSNKNPLLGSLGNYGGETPTVNLLAGSPAINAIVDSSEAEDDQRGLPRPDEASGRPDIGAFEGQAPEITDQPDSQTNSVLGNATFVVGAEGDPPIKYMWMFGSQILSSGTNNILTLSNLSTNDSGAYFAVVSNSFGAVTSAPAVLTLVYPPIIKE